MQPAWRRRRDCLGVEATVKRITQTVLAFAVVLGGTLFPDAASANDFGSQSCGPDPYTSYCIADNRFHSIYFSNLGSAFAASAQGVITGELDARTELVAWRTTYADADVRVYQGNYGSGYWAATYCPSYAAKGGSDPNVWCRPSERDLQHRRAYPWIDDTSGYRTYFACHEFGHTVGLRHNYDVDYYCMYPTFPTSGHLGLHDIYHINLKY